MAPSGQLMYCVGTSKIRQCDVTITVSIATRDSIWTVADRQLMAGDEVSSTDARKIVGVDSTDGIALFGYAGRGAIASQDPSDWAMSVFDGLETDLRGYARHLAEAVARAIPVAERRGAPGHLFVAAGVVDGQPVQYSLVARSDGRLTLREFDKPNAFMLAGSGAAGLRTREKLVAEGQELRDWIQRAEREEAHPREVTDRLAKWNAAAGEASGSRAIVAYRFVRDGEVAAGRCFYDGTTLEPPDSKIPQLTRGVDVGRIFELMKKQAMGGRLTSEEAALLDAYKQMESDG